MEWESWIMREGKKWDCSVTRYPLRVRDLAGGTTSTAGIGDISSRKQGCIDVAI